MEHLTEIANKAAHDECVSRQLFLDTFESLRNEFLDICERSSGTQFDDAMQIKYEMEKLFDTIHDRFLS